jgi:hypothetical protein
MALVPPRSLKTDIELRNHNFALRMAKCSKSRKRMEIWNFKLQLCADRSNKIENREMTRKRKNLRNALLRPLQIPLHLLRILVALRQSGPGSCNALLSESLQILQFTVLRIQETRSANLSETLLWKRQERLTFALAWPKCDPKVEDRKRR